MLSILVNEFFFFFIYSFGFSSDLGFALLTRPLLIQKKTLSLDNSKTKKKGEPPTKQKKKN